MKKLLFYLSLLFSTAAASQSVVVTSDGRLQANCPLCPPPQTIYVRDTIRILQPPVVIHDTIRITNTIIIKDTVCPTDPPVPPSGGKIYNLQFTPLATTQTVPGGPEQWHGAWTVDLSPIQKYYKYARFTWAQLEKSQGVYDWTAFDNAAQEAISRKGRFSFGIITMCPGCDVPNYNINYDGGSSAYPLYLHQLMQTDAVRDWKSNGGTNWVPNYNGAYYLPRLRALLKGIADHIKAKGWQNAIYYVDVRGIGSWGEWNNAGGVSDNGPSGYPSGTYPTSATMKAVIDAHIEAFPDYQLVIPIAVYDGGKMAILGVPADVGYYALTVKNNRGEISPRRDSWGDPSTYIDDNLLINNPTVYNGLAFKTAIMNKWKTAPFVGEPVFSGDLNIYKNLPGQIKKYSASFGNGNYGPTAPTGAVVDSIKLAARYAQPRIAIDSGTIAVSEAGTMSIKLNWSNPQIPTYEDWNVIVELKQSGVTKWSGVSGFKPRNFTGKAQRLDVFSGVPSGSYEVWLTLKDPSGFANPMPLFITGGVNGSYKISTIQL